MSLNKFTNTQTGEDLNLKLGADSLAASTSLVVPQYEVDTLPDPAASLASVAYVSNGAAGAPVLSFCDGANWLRCDSLAAVTDGT
jgi:hypothetical protein